MAKITRFALAVTLLLAGGLVLSGCGNKGSLVLPVEPVADEAPPADELPPSTDPGEADPPAEIDPPQAADPPSDPSTEPVSSGDGDG